MNILEVKKITKTFGGIKAVNNLTLSFEQGKATGIVGPNGSGKSTLMALLSGLENYDTGLVVIRNEKLENITASDIALFGITRTFQEVRVIEQISVLENVLLTLTKRGVIGSLFEKHHTFHYKQAEAVLTTVSLWEKRNALGNELSYGQRRLLEIARVLAMNAEIILFDETFAGLSKKMVEDIALLIETLRTQGKTIVLIEHNMELIRRLSDHLIVLDAGQLLAEGKPEKVLAQKDVIEAYLGE